MSVETDREPFELVAEEFAEEYRRGSEPSIEDYASRYPQLAEEIRDLFPAIQLMEDGGRSARTRGSDTVQTCAETNGGSRYEPAPGWIGRFRIRRLIDSGGFGTVFEALDPDLNRLVALKVPHPEAVVSPEMRSRFIREAEAAAVLDHPGIVPVYESSNDSPCFIVAAYVEGKSLACELAERKRPFEVNEAARMVIALADAVQHAHSRGVLHRDLKPANVLLEKMTPGRPEDRRFSSSNETRPRITDFGLARFVDAPAQTRTSAVMGTASYMAPEQAEGRNRDVTTTADVYALGAILYELLTARPPFRGESTLQTLEEVRTKEPIPPSQRNSLLPRDLDAICLMCLEKSPDRRYLTAKALADDLQRFLDGESVTARRAARWERTGRWFRRNPILASLLSLVAALVVLIALGSALAAIQLDHSRRSVLDHLEREIQAKDAATKNEDLALRALYEARLAQARLGVSSGKLGQRTESLKALSKAAALIPRLKLGEAEKRLLRTNAIAALSLVDLKADRPSSAHGRAFTIDADAERYAYVDAKSNTLCIRQWSDDQELARIERPSKNDVPRRIEFSPDGRFLTCTSSNPKLGKWLLIYDLTSQKLVRDFELPRDLRGRYSDFNADGQWLAVTQPGGAVQILGSPDFSVVKTIPAKGRVDGLRFHPDSSQIAVSRSGRIDLHELNTGKVTQSLACPSFTFRLAWGPDGKSLAAGCEDRRCRIWNVKSGQLTSSFEQLDKVVNVAFHPGGRFLATYSYDAMTRLWDLHSKGQVLVVETGTSFTRFSRDGRWLGYPTGRWRVLLPLDHTAPQPHVAPAKSPVADRLSILPDSRLMVASGKGQLVLWDLATTKPVTAVFTGGIHRFSPTGKHLFWNNGEGGLLQLPIQRHETRRQIQFRIGPPERLCQDANGYLAISRDGNIIAYADRYRRPQVGIFDAAKNQQRVLSPYHRGAKWVSLTPNGKLLATGTWHGNQVKIWDVSTGQVLWSVDAKSAQIAFGPFGRILVIDEPSRYCVWDVQRRRELVPWTAKTIGSNPHSGLALSPNGRMLALPESDRHVRLIETSDWTELASLRLPEGQGFASLVFTPDGRRLVAGTSGKSALIHVWDLARIRRELKSLDLDWDHPPYPPPSPNEILPIQVEVDDGRDG